MKPSNPFYLEIPLILLTSIIATSAMTAFSYLYSNLQKKQFREPELLNILIGRWIKKSQPISKNSLMGWLIHYFVGFLFLIIFSLTCYGFGLKPTMGLGVLLGFLAGFIGIVGWHLTLSLHPNPPRLELKEYYPHLILVHIIFGLSGVITYNCLA